MISKIFATPSEPMFNHEEFSLSREVLEESLNILAQENDHLIETATECSGFFKEGSPVEFILRLCQQLRFPPVTRFVAVELFDRFMGKHISELYETVRNSSGKDRRTDWNNVEQRVKEQLPLRAVTCIQVSSKLASHYKALSPSKAKRILASLGYHYTTASVIKSEIRLLKTLEFRISVPTPLVFLETLLEVLGLNDANIKVKLIHEVALKLLDTFYLKRRQMLEKLCKLTVNEVNGHDVSVLGADYLLLATSIILSAADILNTDCSGVVANQLFNITKIPEKDIADFSKIITREALEDED
ncbi:cyclin N-terminal domain-containing protein 1-like isoform X2 [Rhopilema esculentum]|uniref:cyclin N-terminal domain-containing protein 1-like isoform X2 n=1 Tax=Rhopilema esculentum TaxID=499914 RepID=UPI0031CE8F84|eukprot:gene15634-6918_t